METEKPKKKRGGKKKKKKEKPNAYISVPVSDCVLRENLPQYQSKGIDVALGRILGVEGESLWSPRDEKEPQKPTRRKRAKKIIINT
jgi:hypothetical protein